MIIINEETIRESAAIIDKDNFLRSALSFAVLSAVISLIKRSGGLYGD